VLLLAPLALGTHPVVFGYARPVPVDFRRLRPARLGAVLVALAGPVTNLVLAASSAFLLAWLPMAMHPAGPLAVVRAMARASVQINCVLAVFNLLPVPPLDGGRVLAALLPVRAAGALRAVERVGMVVLFLVVFNTGLVSALVHPLTVLLLGLGR
jgi:Zn-dependent protease